MSVRAAPKPVTARQLIPSTQGNSPDAPLKRIATSKEWVLPPRPKPGRKPSVDVPMTKRKAQNREAQRAFRERRANRVSELEEKLMEVEREHSIKDGLLNNKIKVLSDQVRALTQKNNHLMAIASKREVVQQQVSPTPSSDDKCVICTRDECLCDTLGVRAVKKYEDFGDFQPMSAVPLKRKKREYAEVDFTTKSSRPMPDLTGLQKKQKTTKEANQFLYMPAEGAIDQCGFCSDGTPCVCREAAKELETNLPPLKMESIDSNRKALPVLHPGPTVEVNTIHTQEPEPTSGCTGDPGTCSQCQMDPMSTLFCATLASKPPALETVDKKRVFIPVPDAYKTLSRHQNFSAANFDTMIGKLTTKGMSVEAGSIAAVLRELDRKFGCQ